MALVHLLTPHMDSGMPDTSSLPRKVIPSTHVDSLPRAILVFRPHVSSSGQTYQARSAGWQLSDMGPGKKDTGVIGGAIVRIGI